MIANLLTKEMMEGNEDGLRDYFNNYPGQIFSSEGKPTNPKDQPLKAE